MPLIVLLLKSTVPAPYRFAELVDLGTFLVYLIHFFLYNLEADALLPFQYCGLFRLPRLYAKLCVAFGWKIGIEELPLFIQEVLHGSEEPFDSLSLMAAARENTLDVAKFVCARYHLGLGRLAVLEEKIYDGGHLATFQSWHRHRDIEQLVDVSADFETGARTCCQNLPSFDAPRNFSSH
jgi:hypothetical protein